MNSNGTANKGGKGPVTIKKQDIRSVPESKRRSLFGGFLRSLGARPEVVNDFESRRTMTPPEPNTTPSSPPRTLRGDFMEQLHSPEEKPAEPEPKPEAKPRVKGSPDGYSKEFSIHNLAQLSTLPPRSDECDFSDLDVPQGNAGSDSPHVEISVTASGKGFGITDEDVDRALGGFQPPESIDGSSEASATIIDAIKGEVARRNGGRNPPKFPSERPTIPPSAPLTRDDPNARRTAMLPGSPPEIGIVDSDAVPKSEMTGRTRTRLEELSMMEQAAEIPLGNNKLREKSYVPEYVEGTKQKLPKRFHLYVDEVMGILEKNLKGSEADVEKLIIERRWKIEREQRVLGSIAASADEIQRVFAKMHQDEAVRRVNLKIDESTMVPAEAIKKWAFTVLSSRSPKDGTKLMADSNIELNVFDAYAKAVTFLFLSQMRPRTFIHVLGHPEISKPYGQLGGMEGLGVLAGLDLPDVASAHHIANPMIGLAFRHAQECRSTTLIGWLQDIVVRWPKPFIVGRFAYFVEQEMCDFQEAVQDAGFSAERLFQVLNRENNSPSDLRADPVLIHIFEAACKGPGSVVYTEPDDVFDALEAIVGYTNLLRQVPNAKNVFLGHFLETYPLTTNGGTFWKVFCMCLFTDKEDMEHNPNVVNAFRKDNDPTIRAHIEEEIHGLQPRETLIASSSDGRDDDSIRFSLNDDEF